MRGLQTSFFLYIYIKGQFYHLTSLSSGKISMFQHPGGRECCSAKKLLKKNFLMIIIFSGNMHT